MTNVFIIFSDAMDKDKIKNSLQYHEMYYLLITQKQKYVEKNFSSKK